jgi:hypothetical protein
MKDSPPASRDRAEVMFLSRLASGDSCHVERICSRVNFVLSKQGGSAEVFSALWSFDHWNPFYWIPRPPVIPCSLLQLVERRMKGVMPWQ